MNKEILPQHKEPHLDYGPCPKHFLAKEEANSQNLYDYVGEFYREFHKAEDLDHVIGQTSGVPHRVAIKSSIGDEAYTLSFIRGTRSKSQLERKYKITKGNLRMQMPEEKNWAQVDDQSIKEHALYITAHLRAAGIIELRNEGLQTKQGH